MKKILMLIVLTISLLAILIGCSKSEEEIIRESRAEKGIENLTEEMAVKRLAESKLAIISVFNGINEVEEYTDEDGIVYNPFFEEYNTPEKIRTHIEEYYYGDYAGEIIESIPAKYIDGVYVLPIGDMGRTDDYEDVIVLEKTDVDDENIELRYKMEENSEFYFLVELIYADNSWKIKDESIVYEESSQ